MAWLFLDGSFVSCVTTNSSQKALMFGSANFPVEQPKSETRKLRFLVLFNCVGMTMSLSQVCVPLWPMYAMNCPPLSRSALKVASVGCTTWRVVSEKGMRAFQANNEALAAATTHELVDLLLAIQAKTTEVVEELAERF